MSNKYRNSENTRYLRGLFFEQQGADKSSVLYTLKDVDHEGFPSLYRLYMEFEDLTEWEFANEYLEGWEHWKMLCECTWFKPYIDRWREELDLKIQAQALRRLIKEAEGDSRSSQSANKFLLEKGWVPKEKTKRGRPSKEEVRREAMKKAEETQRLKEDYQRVQETLH